MPVGAPPGTSSPTASVDGGTPFRRRAPCSARRAGNKRRGSADRDDRAGHGPRGRAPAVIEDHRPRQSAASARRRCRRRRRAEAQRQAATAVEPGGNHLGISDRSRRRRPTSRSGTRRRIARSACRSASDSTKFAMAEGEDARQHDGAGAPAVGEPSRGTATRCGPAIEAMPCTTEKSPSLQWNSPGYRPHEQRQA